MKSNLKLIFVLCITIILVFVLILFTNNEEKINFYLMGDGQMTIRLGAEYYEMGFVATDKKGKDLSEYVTINNYINNNQEGSYTVKYTLKKDNVVKVLTRIVKVTDIKDNKYYIELENGNVFHHLKGKEYIDPGYTVYDENRNIVDIDVEVSGNVDISQKGSYLLTYSFNYQGYNDVITRTVEVYDIEYEYIKTIDIKGIILNFLVRSNNLKYVRLPNGIIENNNSFSYNILQNGVYHFDFYDIYGNVKRETIEITEMMKELYCTGVINRYGTNLVISGEDASKNSLYEWYINGIRIVDDITHDTLYKKINNVYIVVDNYGNKEKITCNIHNELIYDFVYDVNNTKPFMQCGTYTIYDKILLDEKLKNSIIQAGYGTRAGVVEAARFLVGGLSYKVPYLGPKKVDFSLGRYQKLGLNIGNSSSWGCRVSGWTQGMDCTNFVDWAFIQNGMNLKNVYGMGNTYRLIDVVNQIRVGDLLLTPNDESFSHVGIIIGIDNENIYVAEATTGKINAIVVTKLSKNNLPKKGSLSIAKLYNYDRDGNITNMWVD